MVFSFKGYHGTSRNRAKKILKEKKFKVSIDFEKNPQYLGDGIYFFQGHAKWAKKWAVEHKKFIKDYCVIKCDINAKDVFDMEDPDDLAFFDYVSKQIVGKYIKEGGTVKILDGIVFNYIYNNLRKFDVARAIYSWERTFNKEYLVLPGLSHTQLCVKNDKCLFAIEEEVI